ncbi:MAG: tetratricopeptide repeat protein [Opitutae bacterium]|nr:tetratricopeptide repeat protein [Opitutae bacterium]
MTPTAPPLPAPDETEQTVARLAAAHPEFAALLAQGVAQSTALTRWGLRCLHAGQAAEASAAFLAATARRPEHAVSWTNSGIALDQAGRTAEAAACFSRSLALAGAQPDVWLLLGLARKKNGDLAGAEAAYRAALQLDPQAAAAWQFLGLLKDEQHDDQAAIDCLLECLRCGGASAAVCANLGKLFYQTGDISRAHDAFTDAVQLDGATPHFHQMLRKCRFLRDTRDGTAPADALAAFARAFPADAPCTEADARSVLVAAFGILSGFGHLAAAQRVGQHSLDLWPDDPEMTYLLDALRPDARLERSPAAYVARHFDAFAESFDRQLVGRLGYDVPEQIAGLLRQLLAAGAQLDVLDAGCGTGLCGPLLRPFARTLAGVDLAPKMLAHAARRGAYDELACADLGEFLEQVPGRYDLVVAADVFIYLGDLAPVVAAATHALRPGGLLVFSTESVTGDGYRLQASGRFAHSAAYVRRVAGAAFREHQCLETTIRLHANTRLPGNLFVFRRATTA